MAIGDFPDRGALDEALRTLDVDRLALGIHASAFPAGPCDIGYGSPHSRAGTALLELAEGLGFNALQLGPNGQISAGNPSPYDGTVFARNVRTIDVEALCEPDFGELLSRDQLSSELGSVATGLDPTRCDPARAGRAAAHLIASAHSKLVALRREHPDHPFLQELESFRTRNRSWLERDCLYEVMIERIGHDDDARFDPAVRALFESSTAGQARRASLRGVLGEALERAELSQLIVHLQAQAFRERARERGLSLIGDLQVGWSKRDRFLHADAFAAGWLLGAPPSRTNPDGQPWGYPLLDPDQLETEDSPARRLLRLRLQRELDTQDGLRIDHPHGLVCPWIYRADHEDPLRAVRYGMRAFSSPDIDDPELRRWAIARESDVARNPGNERWSDRWVSALDEAQVARYARLFDLLIEIAGEHGRDRSDIVIEVLSTCPYPLERVLARHGLGRFRVTQKADPNDPRDVYRTDRAEPADWVMLGNHDTPPIFTQAEAWLSDGSATDRARYLAARLEPRERERSAAAERFCASPTALCQAHLADLFLSAAHNVHIYFVDLLGEREPFNRAGVVHPDNWNLRLPPGFADLYQARRRNGGALDIAAALALALRAREARPDLVAALSPEPNR